MDYKGLICEICGGAEFVEKSNMLVCIHCDATYHKQVEEETDEEKEARILRVSRYDDAEKELRMSPPHFDMAEDKFVNLNKDIVFAKFDCAIIPHGFKTQYGKIR